MNELLIEMLNFLLPFLNFISLSLFLFFLCLLFVLISLLLLCFFFFSLYTIAIAEFFSLCLTYIAIAFISTKKKRIKETLKSDRAKRHDFWPRLWLFFSPFLFPLKKREEEKDNELEKIVNKGHAFLLDLWLMIKNHGKKKERQMIVITIEKVIREEAK